MIHPKIFRALRHGHASMLIEIRIDIYEISKHLGHESIKTTIDTYGHLYPDKALKLARALNDLRRPQRSEDEKPSETT